MQLYQLVELKARSRRGNWRNGSIRKKVYGSFDTIIKNHCMNMEHLFEEGEYESLGKYLKQFAMEELGEVRSIYSDSPFINAIFHNKNVRV